MRKLCLCLILSLFPVNAWSSTLYVGTNAASPIDIFQTDGTLVGTYGSNDATAAVSNGAGDTYVAVPDVLDNQTTIYLYGSDPTTPLGQYTFTGTDPGNSDGYIEDLAYGGGDTIWMSAFNGMIYHVNFGAMMILSSFNAGSAFTGIAANGSLLYATTGFASGVIDTFDLSGNPGAAIFTGLTDTLGIGYDSLDGTLWVGGDGVVSHVSLAGAILSSFPVLDGSGGPVDVSGLGVNDMGVSSTPEPASFGVAALGLFFLFFYTGRSRKRAGKAPRPCVHHSGVTAVLLLVTGVIPAFSTPAITSLMPSLTPPQPVGTPVTFTATASDGANPLWYRFSVSPPGGTFSIVRDYQSVDSFSWTPTQFDGLYQVQVTVKNQNDQTTSQFMVSFAVSPLATTQPVVTPTGNVLVALYSAPPCPPGSSMRVRFWKQGDVLYRSTPAHACSASSSMNFYVAGMAANTAYFIQHDVLRGPQVTTGPRLEFTTGTPPVSIPVTVVTPSQPPDSQIQPFILFSGLPGVPNGAVDLNGNLVWYYTKDGAYITRPETGGNMLVLVQPPQNTMLNEEQNSELYLLREVDVAGNTLFETNTARVSELLGFPVTIIHHEARRLPNGNLIFMAACERIADQGAGPVDVVGDVIVELDTNLNLVWSWNIFDHLDVSRPSTSGDIVAYPAFPSSPPIYLATKANDWTHSNCLFVTSDGKYILLSVRHQDWLLKIDFNNGTGSGNVIWKLGYQGDFSLASGNPSDWFSHQHEAEFELNGQQIISLFDNGNTRQQPAPTRNSRGQVWSLDENTMVASLQLNVDLGVQSLALGSAQRLLTGNYEFDAGFLNPSDFVDVNPGGGLVSKITIGQRSYRCFRMQDLYTP